MLKRYFIRQGIKEVQIQRFIKGNFPNGDYSDIVLQRTPLGLKIVIHTNKPGKIIGRGGSNINMITDALKERFNLLLTIRVFPLKLMGRQAGVRVSV